MPAREMALTKDSPTAAMAGALPDARAAVAADPLPCWNDGPTKQSVLDFVEKVTKEGSPFLVPVAERIATFDNDGTLRCEQPAPVQAYFARGRVKALAPQHPEWKTQEPFASLLEGDLRATLAAGEHELLEIVMATHAGMTTASTASRRSRSSAAASRPGSSCATANRFCCACRN